MPRQLTNVSGQLMALQDSRGVWHTVEPGDVYAVDAADERYFPTGECGEDPIWQDTAPVVPKTTSKTRTTKIEEAS